MIALSVIYPSTKSTNLLALGGSVPIGQSGIVTIWGRNDMPTTQQMGIEWTLRDPDGEIVEHYGPEWEMWPYCPPGEAHKFDGGRFDLDKAGTYTIAVDLLMNRDNPVTVDSYDGDLCTVTTELPPEYVEIQHTIYPFAYIYEGDSEVCIYTLKLPPEQITPPEWLGEKISSAFADEMKKQGGQILELKVYADTTPTFWTDLQIKVTAAVSSGETAGVAMWPAWAIILVAVIVLIGIAFIAWAIKEVVTILFKREPGLEDVKPAWDRETLIPAINQYEEYKGKPVTPREELEKMSDDELREYLDGLVPPPVPDNWLPLVILGGLGVLGVGGIAAAYAMTKPKEGA